LNDGTPRFTLLSARYAAKVSGDIKEAGVSTAHPPTLACGLEESTGELSPPVTCSKLNTLETVINQLVNKHVHRYHRNTGVSEIIGFKSLLSPISPGCSSVMAALTHKVSFHSPIYLYS
jgi:hypothetical protein